MFWNPPCPTPAIADAACRGARRARLGRPRLPFLAMLSLSALFGCSGAQPPMATRASAHGPDCRAPARIGHFDAARDLLIANFDSKTDPDDFHSVAALATMLADPRLACVRYIAVAGAYGQQEGKFLPAPRLYDLAFRSRWTDADRDREQAAALVAAEASEALRKGGHIWVQEAGQSDFTAMVLRRLEAAAPGIEIRARITVVQHSDWNEEQTAPEALAYVGARTGYVKIPDGNVSGNGSPGFRTADGALWEAVLSRPRIGAIWAEARRQASSTNGRNGGYDNPAIAAGGFDFSDAAEAAWIFGFSNLRDPADFFKTFR